MYTVAVQIAVRYSQPAKSRNKFGSTVILYIYIYVLKNRDNTANISCEHMNKYQLPTHRKKIGSTVARIYIYIHIYVYT